MLHSIFVFLLMLLINTQTSHATPVEWAVSAGGNGHYYELVQTTRNFSDAKTAAESSTYRWRKGQLLTLNTQAEYDWFRASSVIPSSGIFSAWMGGEYNTATSTYQWYDREDGPTGGTTRETLQYTNYDTSVLNTSGTGLIYRRKTSGSTTVANNVFRTESTSLTRWYIVEYSAFETIPGTIPLPQSAVFLLSGLLGMALVNRRKKLREILLQHS